MPKGGAVRRQHVGFHSPLRSCGSHRSKQIVSLRSQLELPSWPKNNGFVVVFLKVFSIVLSIQDIKVFFFYHFRSVIWWH